MEVKVEKCEDFGKANYCGQCGMTVTEKPFVLVVDGQAVCALCAEKAGLKVEFVDLMARNYNYRETKQFYDKELERLRLLRSRA